MSWDIEVREKVYQRLANEIFFRILHGEYGLGTKMPSYTELQKRPGAVRKPLERHSVNCAASALLIRPAMAIL